MRRVRDIAVWILLTTLVVGGVAGPVVHRIQHSTEQSAVSLDRPCHTASVHDAERPTLADTGLTIEAPDCDLCATRLVVILPDMSPSSSRYRGGAIRVAVRTHLTPVPVVTDRYIRGPPFRSRARLS